MRSIHEGFHDRKGYLERLAKPMQEKLRIAEHIPPHASLLLDVGCADGAVTRELSHLFPTTTVHGIDLDASFIEQAHTSSRDAVHPPRFECVYLRDMLARPERFDAIMFTSVLHEFFSYGEGTSSVVKAIADAFELLHPGGKIIVRDMIFSEKAKLMPAPSIVSKIRAAPDMQSRIADFERTHGAMETLHAANHFLLKYFYSDNWMRECAEEYAPVTLEQYRSLFMLLGASIEHEETYLIPFLRGKWRTDFKLSDEELSALHSTTIFSVQKPTGQGV
ncbi:methyltransferase domain-containing protein [Candidatus Kaiserbacteria bacterium]|nr:methyltransferase domain-containing protein [Candidatus Kaiserbacteria bacterium]